MNSSVSRRNRILSVEFRCNAAVLRTSGNNSS